MALTEYVHREVYEAIQIRSDQMDALRELAEQNHYLQLTPDDGSLDRHRFPVQMLTRSGWIGLTEGTWLVRERSMAHRVGFHWTNLSNWQFRQQFRLKGKSA